MNDQAEIDWTLTTWEGSRRAQIRQALAMTFRERMEAMEGLADVARRIQKICAEDGLASPHSLAKTAEHNVADEPNSRTQ